MDDDEKSLSGLLTEDRAMISWLHLFWIVPLSAYVGFLLAVKMFAED